MPIQAPQWSEFRTCPVCQNDFNSKAKLPVSLGCGHTICRSCLLCLSKQQCPFDQVEIKTDIKKLPINCALLKLAGGKIPVAIVIDVDEIIQNRAEYDAVTSVIEAIAVYLLDINANSTSNNTNGSLTRPMQRKVVALLHSQLAEDEGRARAVRSARSIAERVVKELILMHQNSQTLSATLWAAVRQRGCQFLGPAMQEAVLKQILLALEDGISLSRKVLVLFVVQKLEKSYTQASKTSIGHVVQLLYRASCFKVTKRDGDSSLLQLHEKHRTYSTLRKEHDAQIVQIAMEAGLHISPEQWSALLYGGEDQKSNMQSIIDKLQTPASFASSIQELIIALQRTGDPHNLESLRIHFDKLASIDPSPESPAPTWPDLKDIMNSLLLVVEGLQAFAKDYASKNKGNIEGAQMINTKYRTSMCRDILQRNSCPRGSNCNFAHSEEEVERYRKRRNMVKPATTPITNGQFPPSPRSGSSPDSCSANDLDDDLLEQQQTSQNINAVVNRHQQLSIAIPPNQMAIPQQFREHPSQPAPMRMPPSMYSEMHESVDNRSPFSPPHQQQIKKDEGFPRDIMQPKTSPDFNGAIHHQVVARPPPAVLYQYYVTNPNPNHPHPMVAPPQYCNASPSHAAQHQPSQMYLSNNQHAFMSGGQHLVQQQHPAGSNYSDFPQHQFNYNGGNHHQFGFPSMAVVARDCGSETSVRSPSDFIISKNEQSNASRESNPLNKNLLTMKEKSEDIWTFNGNDNNTTSKVSPFARVDSWKDSGRGSSLGYLSDTLSPLSSSSSGSSSYPIEDEESPRSFLQDSKIWSAPTWSHGSTKSSSHGWEALIDSSRLSDGEERNNSSESIGKSSDRQVSPLMGIIPNMRDWNLNNASDVKAHKKPPPGFLNF